MDSNNPQDAKYSNYGYSVAGFADGRLALWSATEKEADKEMFGIIGHETAHGLDVELVASKGLYRFSWSDEWMDSIDNDNYSGSPLYLTDYTQYKYEQMLAGSDNYESYLREDFAEAIRLYLTDRDYFKNTFPNRFGIIERFFQ